MSEARSYSTRCNSSNSSIEQHSTSAYHVLSEHMSLLSALVSRLGNLEEWPSAILQRLFVDEPTCSNVETVASFFYGNGASTALCSQTFHACNAATTVHVTNQIYSLYTSWQRSPYGHKTSVYYNLSCRSYLYLNGKKLDQFEEARPPRGGRRFGIRDTGHLNLINARLQHIRDVGVMYYP